MEIRDANYRVWYEASSQTIYFEGLLRLGTNEYEPITNLLNQILETNPAALTLHMHDLAFLNSSGINTLYKFAIALRKQGKVKVTVKASSLIPWQSKSLANLKKFLPSIDIQTQ